MSRAPAELRRFLSLFRHRKLSQGRVAPAVLLGTQNPAPWLSLAQRMKSLEEEKMKRTPGQAAIKHAPQRLEGAWNHGILGSSL